jgi:hypothetical protein
MNRNLQRDYDDDALLTQLDRNLSLARELGQEIRAEAGCANAAATSHLSEVFSAMPTSSASATPTSSVTARPPGSSR